MSIKSEIGEKIRMNFEGNFIDSHLKASELVAKEIESGSNASKSAKAVALQ